jgi:hypothetical protein
MPDKNIFIVSSTINTHIGLIDPHTRYLETIGTIESIRQQVQNSIIILIDNSIQNLPADIENHLASLADIYLYIGNRRACIDFNKAGVRSAGEAYIMLVAIDLIKTHVKYDIHRIFKLSGRYKLSKDFDIFEYHDEKYVNRYCFKTNNSKDDTCYHTRLWSFCHTLTEETRYSIQRALQDIFQKNVNIEDALYSTIDPNKVVMKDKVSCEGQLALWNDTYVIE